MVRIPGARSRPWCGVPWCRVPDATCLVPSAEMRRAWCRVPWCERAWCRVPDATCLVPLCARCRVRRVPRRLNLVPPAACRGCVSGAWARKRSRNCGRGSWRPNSTMGLVSVFVETPILLPHVAVTVSRSNALGLRITGRRVPPSLILEMALLRRWQRRRPFAPPTGEWGYVVGFEAGSKKLSTTALSQSSWHADSYWRGIPSCASSARKRGLAYWMPRSE